MCNINCILVSYQRIVRMEVDVINLVLANAHLLLLKLKNMNNSSKYSGYRRPDDPQADQAVVRNNRN